MSSPESKHRVFFALWPSDVLRGQIARQTQQLARAAGGRPIPAGNLHVTLLFLGAVTLPTLTEVANAASRLRLSSFEIEFDQATVWPRSNVLVLGASRSPAALRLLVEGLRISALQAEAVLEPEDYRPHITLARNVERLRHSLPESPRIRWSAKEFVLVESKSGSEGSVYTVIHRWPLA